VWIKNYKGIIQDQEYNLSANHQFSYDAEKKELRLKSNQQVLPKNFFGGQVTNVSAIVGENGVGKSSFFTVLLTELVHNKGSAGTEYISIWWDGSGYFTFGMSQSDYSLMGFDAGERAATNENVIVSYYPLLDFTRKNKILEEEVGYHINLCDNSMMLKDFEQLGKEDKLKFTKAEFWRATSYLEFGDVLRAVGYFLNVTVDQVPKAKRLAIVASDIERDLQDIVKVSKSKKADSKFYPYEQRALTIYLKESDKKGPKPELTYHALLKVWRQFFVYMVYKLINLDQVSRTLDQDVDRERLGWKRELRAFLEESKKKLDEMAAASVVSIQNIKSFFEWISEKEIAYSDISDTADQALRLVDTRLSVLIENESDHSTPYTFTLLLQEDFEETKSTIWDVITIFAPDRPFNLAWLGDDYEPYNYSTGEQHFLKLFSRLQDMFFKLIEHDDYKYGKSIILLLDESELGLHPEWQQRFIKWLTDFLNSELQPKFSVQIILATHSPLMLSDIPHGNIVRLSKLPQESEQKKTFGANIHRLLADSFFLSKGFIGEFARAKIEKVMALLQQNEDISIAQIEEANQIIELIGEPLIQNKLRKLFREKFPAFLGESPEELDKNIKLQQEILRELEERRKRNEDNQ
jgi:uncharacterized protein YxeA